MAEVIFDNPTTLCREIYESFSNNHIASQLMFSTPKAAVETRLSVFFRPWGSYEVPQPMGGARRHKKNPNCGIRRDEKEFEALYKLFEKWDAIPRGSATTFVAFWENEPNKPDGITLSAFKNFCYRQRDRKLKEAQENVENSTV